MGSFRTLALCALLFLPSRPALAGDPATPGPDFFGNLIQQRLDNVAKGNSAGYLAFIHPELVHISDNGTRRTAPDMAAFVKATAGTALHGKRFAVSDVHVTFRDGLAFVDALVTETHDVAGRTFEGRFRESDVLVKVGDAWKFWRHQESLLPTRVAQVDADTTDYPDYAGRYQYWDGFAENIHHRDGALWVEFIGENDPQARLLPLSDSTFYLEGDPSRMTFLRDRNGKILGYQLVAPDGALMFARRLP